MPKKAAQATRGQVMLRLNLQDRLPVRPVPPGCHVVLLKSGQSLEHMGNELHPSTTIGVLHAADAPIIASDSWLDWLLSESSHLVHPSFV